jgi:hypothetical protein
MDAPEEEVGIYDQETDFQAPTPHHGMPLTRLLVMYQRQRSRNHQVLHTAVHLEDLLQIREVKR